MRALVVVCCITARAFAQPAPPPDKPADARPVEPAKEPPKSLTKFDVSKVEALFEQGTRHYDLGQWDQAITAFKKAYELMPDSSFLFNLGQAYRQKGSCREATVAYKAYLRHATDDRSKVEAFLRELESCARLEEENARRLLPPPRLSERHRKLRVTGLAIAGAGAALLAAAGYFTVISINRENELEKCNVGPTACPGELATRVHRKGERAERLSIGFGIAGGATALIGATLFAYTRFRGEYITVMPTPTGVVASAAVGF
jgi:tetratricopeptide (TPR) repeat protein